MRHLARFWVVARYLRLRDLALACVVSLVLCAVLPLDPIDVPGRLGVFAVVTNLLPAVPAVVLPACLDRICVREAVSQRGQMHVGGVLIGGCAVLLASTSAGAHLLGVPTYARNAAILMSLAGLLWLLGGSRATWPIVVVFVMANWLLGIRTDQTARPWALLMSANGSVGADVVALVGVCAATLGLTRRWWRS